MFCSNNGGEKVYWKDTDALVGFSSLENARYHLAIQIPRARRPLIKLYRITLFLKTILSDQDVRTSFGRKLRKSMELRSSISGRNVSGFFRLETVEHHRRNPKTFRPGILLPSFMDSWMFSATYVDFSLPVLARSICYQKSESPT
jgi:hypothetical protein